MFVLLGQLCDSISYGLWLMFMSLMLTLASWNRLLFVVNYKPGSHEMSVVARLVIFSQLVIKSICLFCFPPRLSVVKTLESLLVSFTSPLTDVISKCI